MRCFDARIFRRKKIPFVEGREKSLLQDSHQSGEKITIAVQTPGSQVGSPAAVEERRGDGLNGSSFCGRQGGEVRV